MRKVVTFVLLFAYTTLACGINVHLHYCGGKLKSIALFDTVNKDCCNKKMKSKNCCNKKTTLLKVKDKHNSNSSLITLKNKSSEVQNTSFIDKFHAILLYEFITDYHFPPVLYDNPKYLKNRVLII